MTLLEIEEVLVFDVCDGRGINGAVNLSAEQLIAKAGAHRFFAQPNSEI